MFVEGQVIAVTGAGGGIGQQLVMSIIDGGAKVVALDLNAAALEVLRNRIACKNQSQSLICINADLGDPEAADAAIFAAADVFGRLDGLVIAAGLHLTTYRRHTGSHRPKFWDVAPSTWNSFMRANADGVFWASRAAAPIMIKQEFGRIIVVTTGLYAMVGAGMCPYGPTKAAAEALSSVMAYDLCDTGVTVNVITPGATVATQMAPEEMRQSGTELLSPEVMVAPLLWLLSGDAGHVTGWRIRANLWNANCSPSEALRVAGDQVAWRGIAKGPAPSAQ